MDSQPPSAPGEYARIRGHIGFLAGDADGMFLCPVPGLPDQFEPFTVTRAHYPLEALSPEALFNIIAHFIATADRLHSRVKAVAAPSTGDIAHPHQTRWFELNQVTYYTFNAALDELGVHSGHAWRFVAFYRMFGEDYGAARERFEPA
jgi:hypothetical protein